MATRHMHFADEPPQVMNQADLDRANEKLENADEDPERSSKDASDNDAPPHHRHDPRVPSSDGEKLDRLGTYDKYELTEDDAYEELGFSYPSWKKWYILSVIFIVQVSMNFNTSLYSNAIPGISEEFGVSAQAARCGAMIFLVMYAFGCELWAPWSEEFGRCPSSSSRSSSSTSGKFLWHWLPTLGPSWPAVPWAVCHQLVAPSLWA